MTVDRGDRQTVTHRLVIQPSVKGIGGGESSLDIVVNVKRRHNYSPHNFQVVWRIKKEDDA